MARVRTVTGMPTRACSRQPILMPKRPACSTTMMFAMLPTMRRLPASVLDRARMGPACAWPRATGSNSITAGTFDTRFESATVMPKSHGAREGSTPVARRPSTA